MKPVTGIAQFAGLQPPWQLQSLDANISALQAALNDLGTYGNALQDTSGAANSITVNTAPGLTASLAFGLPLLVKVANTNTTTSVNLNINNLGNVPVVNSDGTALTVGALAAAGMYLFYYDSIAGNFKVAAPAVASSSFQATPIGISSPSLVTINYTKVGNLVCMLIPAFSGASSSNGLQLSGVPGFLSPASIPFIAVPDFVALNASVTATDIAVQITGAQLTFMFNGQPTNWSPTGTKGMLFSFPITYVVI